jgi:glycine/D-amino acid oxidase-like deaminating enzyme
MAKVVIIGGGVIGSSIAYYLALAGHAADVVMNPTRLTNLPPPRAQRAASASCSPCLKISAWRSTGTIYTGISSS